MGMYSTLSSGDMMKTMTYTKSRAHYAETLDAVVNDREEVVVALDDYESLKESAYLLRNPANARWLLAAIKRLEQGQGVPHHLTE